MWSLCDIPYSLPACELYNEKILRRGGVEEEGNL